VAFHVLDGVLTVTAPLDGTGTVSLKGKGSAGLVGGFGVSCPWKGTFYEQFGDLQVDGTWKCSGGGITASGDWWAFR
jgi:hypothetical protein